MTSSGKNNYSCFSLFTTTIAGVIVFVLSMAHAREHEMVWMNANDDLYLHMLVKLIMLLFSIVFLIRKNWYLSWRFIVYFALVSAMQHAASMDIRNEYKARMENYWFPGVHYDKQNDIFIDFNDYNNAYAIAKTVVVHPRNEGLWDWIKSKLGYHNWPKPIFEALVRHEKGHAMTLPFFNLLTAMIFDIAWSNFNIIASPLFLLGAWTWNSWLAELVADMHAGKQGIDLLRMITKDRTQHASVVTGSIGLHSHPPMEWRFLACHYGNTLWPFVSRINVLIVFIFAWFIVRKVQQYNKWKTA